MNVLNTLFPLFFLIALGAILRWRNITGDLMIKDLNRLVFWIGLPSLLFVKVATANSQLDSRSLGVLWVLLLATGATAVIAFIFCIIFRFDGEKAGPFIQGAFRGNWAYIGLTVIFFAFANSPDKIRATANDTAALVIGPIVAIYNIASIIILLAGKHSLNARAFKRMFINMLVNPLLLACIFGIAWNLFKIPLPVFLSRSLETAGNFALPVALICVGGSLMQTKIKGFLLNPAILSAVIKVFICPLIGYFIARWMGIGGVETMVALFLLATPTAVNSFTVADQLGCDSLIAAEIVIVSTTMSIISLGIVLGLFSSFVR
ncbi:MAG TPA: AEC family transporter [Phycisphaerae bacterium]|nr:AEC family transporter [Phycisphaerae bacterium]HPS52552.1 AEC family transporter [Phycisphaerae bacterium]